MDNITKLNTTKLSLSITKVENILVKNVASVAYNLTNVSHKITSDMNENSIK